MEKDELIHSTLRKSITCEVQNFGSRPAASVSNGSVWRGPPVSRNRESCDARAVGGCLTGLSVRAWTRGEFGVRPGECPRSARRS